MTIQINDQRKDYKGNGLSAAFAGPRLFEALHVTVLVGTAPNYTVVPTSEYTVSGLGAAQSLITFAMPPADQSDVLILRTVPNDQPADLRSQSAYLPEVHENAFDYHVMQLQQINAAVDMSLHLPQAYRGIFSTTLPSPSPLSPLVFNASGTAIEAGSTTMTGDMLLRADLAAASGAELVGMKQGGAGSVYRTLASKLAESVSVKDFGAIGDAVTDDTDAFNMALNSGALRVFIPKGSYNVHDVTVPSNVTLYGEGKNSSQLRPTLSCDVVVRMLGHSTALDLSVNGNNKAQKCFSIAGDYCRIEKTHAQFAGRGYHNEAFDVWTLEGTSSDNCIYSIYSAERGINCVISKHESRGSDTYGFYATYIDQQPQAIRFDHCLFFGNQFGIWFEKDTFFITIAKTIVDGCTSTGIHFGESAPGTAVDYLIEDCFIFADTIAVEIGAGCNHTIIRGGTLANGSFANVMARATAVNRTTSITLDGVNIGTCQNHSVILDSVVKAVLVNCTFTAPPTSQNVLALATYAGGVNPVVDVKGCNFSKENAVDSFNTRVRDCIGQVNCAYGVGTIQGGATSVLINHGMSRAPTHVIVTLQANLGGVYWTDASSTQFRVNVATAAAGSSPFSWEARCD